MAELVRIPVYPIVLTLLAFQIGRWVQGRWKLALFNPTLIATALVIAVLLLTGAPVADYSAGAGKIAWLMTPATISLAIPMYEQFRLLRKHLAAIAAGVAAGAVSSLLILLLGGILLHLPREIAVSLLPKSVTTAIGVPLSELFGGMGGVTTAAIIVTGILANMLGPALCKLLHITDPVAQGVALGTAGHVIGTAKAGELSPLTGAVSSLSLVVAGILTALCLPLLVHFV